MLWKNGLRLDLHLQRRQDQSGNLDQCRSRAVFAKVSLPDRIDLLPIGDVGQVDGDLDDVLRAGSNRLQAGVHVGNGKLELLDDIAWDAAVRSDSDGSGYPDQIACFGYMAIVADRLRLAIQHQTFYCRHILFSFLSAGAPQPAN